MPNYYYDDYDNYDDEVSDDKILSDLYSENHTIELDDPDTWYDDEDEDDIIDNEPITQKTLLSALRYELKLKEFERGSLSFKKDGVSYEGVPMLEINPNKFVFKLEPDNKLKIFLLSDIQVE